jgi:hypothetical protein
MERESVAERLLLPVANLGSHASLLAAQLSPTFTGFLRSQIDLLVAKVSPMAIV